MDRHVGSRLPQVATPGSGTGTDMQACMTSKTLGLNAHAQGWIHGLQIPTALGLLQA